MPGYCLFKLCIRRNFIKKIVKSPNIGINLNLCRSCRRLSNFPPAAKLRRNVELCCFTPPANEDMLQYVECGMHISVACEIPAEYLLRMAYDDECNSQQRPNLLFGCLPAASDLKNAFVLVQISRFQQVIGAFTLQAPTETAKVRAGLSEKTDLLLLFCASSQHLGSQSCLDFSHQLFSVYYAFSFLTTHFEYPYFTSHSICVLSSSRSLL